MIPFHYLKIQILKADGITKISLRLHIHSLEDLRDLVSSYCLVLSDEIDCTNQDTFFYIPRGKFNRKSLHILKVKRQRHKCKNLPIVSYQFMLRF